MVYLYKDYLLNKRQYQEDGHKLLLERKHACLFYKPGKGKTYPCIDALRDVAAEIEFKERRNINALILSTADAIRNMWEVEIVPQNILPKGTILMTVNSAIRDDKKAMLLKTKWDVVIVDESHKIKSNTTKISKLVYQLTKKSKYAWGLTGTPRGNTDLDIFCQFHNLNIGDWGTISYTMFVDQCCDVEQKFFGATRFKIPIGINHRYIAGWERNLAMYSQRIWYDEDDDMPGLNVDVIKLPYEPTKEYKDAEQGVINLTEYSTTMAKLTAIQKMHQAVNGYLYIDTDERIYRFQHNAKLDWLQEHLDVTRPTTIVYRHMADLQDLRKLYPNATEVVNDFKEGKSNILLLQCSRCESFNLQMCNSIIFYTLDYSYIKYNQMIHRCWRMGQENDVSITILTFDKTIETKIWNTVRNKEKLADLFMSLKR